MQDRPNKIENSSLQALESEVVEEEVEDLGNCPICVQPFQVGDQVLFFFSSKILQLFLLLADPVPWLPWVATPRLSPWLPSTMALEVYF